MSVADLLAEFERAHADVLRARAYLEKKEREFAAAREQVRQVMSGSLHEVTVTLNETQPAAAVPTV